MPGSRVIAFVLAAAAPAVAYRLGGVPFWTSYAALLTVAASFAAFVLWQDELLRGVMLPKRLDVAWGVGGAAVLYLLVVLAYNNLVAPSTQLGPLLRQCGANGPTVPHGDAHGFGAVLESARAQVCYGYVRSLGVLGPPRGFLLILIACLEEIAWRGGVQQALSEKLGSTRGWLAASVLYGAAMAGTGNWPLALASFAGALLWGGLYRYRGRLAPAFASHAVFSFFLFYSQPLVSIR
jgi:membrane protease YdiL (CAAX protease family)